jgi:hypothetical protein
MANTAPQVVAARNLTIALTLVALQIIQLSSRRLGDTRLTLSRVNVAT